LESRTKSSDGSSSRPRSRVSGRKRVKTYGSVVQAIFQSLVESYSPRGSCPSGKAQSDTEMVVVSHFPEKCASRKGSAVRKYLKKGHLLLRTFPKMSVLGRVACASHFFPVALLP